MQLKKRPNMSDKAYYKAKAQRKRSEAKQGRISREYKRKTSTDPSEFPDVMVLVVVENGTWPRKYMRNVYNEHQAGQPT